MRILLVDNDRECLAGLQIALQPAGYECEATTDPVLALNLYKQNRFDLVISELEMPGCTGFTLLRQLKKWDPGAHVIIITAYGEEGTGAEALREQACAFFSKPLNFRDFIKILRQLEEHGPRSAAGVCVEEEGGV